MDMSGFLDNEKLRYVWSITGFRTAKKPVLHGHKLGRTDWPCLLWIWL